MPYLYSCSTFSLAAYCCNSLLGNCKGEDEGVSSSHIPDVSNDLLGKLFYLHKQVDVESDHLHAHGMTK